MGDLSGSSEEDYRRINLDAEFPYADVSTRLIDEQQAQTYFFIQTPKPHTVQVLRWNYYECPNTVHCCAYKLAPHRSQRTVLTKWEGVLAIKQSLGRINYKFVGIFKK